MSGVSDCLPRLSFEEKKQLLHVRRRLFLIFFLRTTVLECVKATLYAVKYKKYKPCGAKGVFNPCFNVHISQGSTHDLYTQDLKLHHTTPVSQRFRFLCVLFITY
jgi:hypothetical protein